MRRHLTRLAAALAVLIASACLIPTPVSALNRGTIGTMTPTKTHLEFEGPPLAGLYPFSNAPAEPFANFKPEACRSVTYCDTIEIEVDYEPDYIREVFFGVSITLEWANPYDDSKNPTGNDVDLFLWGNDDPVSGGPASKCQSPTDPPPGEEGERCNNVFPETIAVTEPPNTIPDDADPAALLVTVVNDKGINTGYKLTVDWFTYEIDPPPSFVPPKRETTRGRGVTPDNVSGPFDFEVTDSRAGAPTPKPTPRTILVPGADGELHEIELPIFAAGETIATPNESSGATPWIVAGGIGVVAMGGSIFLLARRNRRLMET